MILVGFSLHVSAARVDKHHRASVHMSGVEHIVHRSNQQNDDEHDRRPVETRAEKNSIDVKRLNDMWSRFLRRTYAVTGVATGQKAKKSSGRMKASEMVLMARP
jgi:hypothetical protein